MSEKTKIRVTMTLDAGTVEAAVRDFVERAGHSVESVSINVGKSLEGYGIGEHEVVKLTGATVVLSAGSFEVKR